MPPLVKRTLAGRNQVHSEGGANLRYAFEAGLSYRPSTDWFGWRERISDLGR